MQVLRMKLDGFMEKDEYTECPVYAFARMLVRKEVVQNKLLHMQTMQSIAE